jgi:dihydrodipicolinate reductase
MTAPLKIFLVGYGGMGHEIERAIADDPSTELVGIFDPTAFPEQGPVAMKKYRCGIKLKQAISKSGAQVVIEFSTDIASEKNLETYLALKVPFVNGTTSWEYDLAAEAVSKGFPCVVDQNMHPVLVAFKDGLAYMAEKYPKVMKAYSLYVTEEHQETKALPSGTAPVWAKFYKRMGAIVAPLESIRQGKEPHAYHWYRLIRGFLGKAGTEIQLKTLIWGRRDYALGAIMAAKFVSGEVEPMVYDMRDVLRAQ